MVRSREGDGAGRRETGGEAVTARPHIAALGLLAATVLAGCEPEGNIVAGAQCSRAADYADGSLERATSAVNEGKGFVSQSRTAFDASTSASGNVTVVANCATGQGASIGLWGNEPVQGGAAFVSQFVKQARSKGLMTDLAALVASAQQTGMTNSLVRKNALRYDDELSCACKLYYPDSAGAAP